MTPQEIFDKANEAIDTLTPAQLTFSETFDSSFTPPVITSQEQCVTEIRRNLAIYFTNKYIASTSAVLILGEKIAVWVQEGQLLSAARQGNWIDVEMIENVGNWKQVRTVTFSLITGLFVGIPSANALLALNRLNQIRDQMVANPLLIPDIFHATPRNPPDAPVLLPGGGNTILAGPTPIFVNPPFRSIDPGLDRIAQPVKMA